MTTQSHAEFALSPRLRTVIDDIEVSDDGLAAQVGPQTVSAEYPREMVRVLAEAIYNVHHAGQKMSAVPSRLRDRDVEDVLHSVTPHRTTWAQVQFLRAANDDAGNGQALVYYRGVRVWVPVESLGPDEVAPGDELTIPFPAVRPAVSPGFFLTEGSVGWTRGAQVMRLYLHVPTVDAAVVAWRAVLEHLEDTATPYRAKVLTAAEFYPRRDSMVVYLEDTAPAMAKELVARVSSLGVLAEETSAFARCLGPGAATAAEPRDPEPSFRGLSFGQHRATLLATALLAARGDLSRRKKEVFAMFTQHGADPAAPDRNLTI